MTPSEILFFFDYLDPLSYLQDLDLEELAGVGEAAVRRIPLEMRPPPLPLLDPEGEEWLRLWREATAVAAARGMDLACPALLPWTRKAHELVLHAGEKGRGDEAHGALFRAVFVDGADIGRVDVLVDLASGLGLDPTETKAVLDVDRHTAAVADLRRMASSVGVTGTPALALGARTLQGFHNRDDLRTFLRSPQAQ